MKRIAIYPLLLLFALCGCKGKTGTSQAGNVFKPGEIWPDNNGVHINAQWRRMLQQAIPIIGSASIRQKAKGEM